MRSFYIVFAFVAMLSSGVCKQDAAAVQEGASQETSAQNTGAAAQESSKLSDGSAAATGGHDYTFLTDKLFHYKAAFGGANKGGEQPYKDEWIDLDANGTYKAGKLKQETHTGKWTYSHETKLLFLKPDVNTFPMSEWKVMYNNQMMVWVGTQTYGNNATQIQLARSDVMP